MKNKLIIILTFIFLISNGLISQDDKSLNNVNLEFFGKGLYYSVNYERNVYELNEEISFNASIGMCIFSGMTSIEKSNDFLMPFEISAMYSKDNHHFIFGYGTTFWKYKVLYIDIDNSNLNQQPLPPSLETIKEWFAHFSFDYKYMKPEGGLILKGGYTPLFFAASRDSKFSKKINYQTSFNLGVGWGF